MERRAYLMRCALISLRKRGGWLLLAGAVGGGAGWVLGVIPVLSALLGLLLLLVVALYIAANSCLRHADDPEAKRGTLPLHLRSPEWASRNAE